MATIKLVVRPTFYFKDIRLQVKFVSQNPRPYCPKHLLYNLSNRIISMCAALDLVFQTILLIEESSA